MWISIAFMYLCVFLLLPMMAFALYWAFEAELRSAKEDITEASEAVTKREAAPLAATTPAAQAPPTPRMEPAPAAKRGRAGTGTAQLGRTA
jgi:hypothetical protein